MLNNLNHDQSKTPPETSKISLPSKPKISPQYRIFGIGSLNKAVSSPSTLFIEASPVTVNRVIAFDGFG